MSNADDDPGLPGLEDLGDIDDEILSGSSGELEGFEVVDELEEDELIEGDGDGDGHVTDRDQLNSTFKSPKTEVVDVQSTPTRTTRASTVASATKLKAVPTKISSASKTPTVKTGTTVKATAPTTAKTTAAQNAQKTFGKLAASATSTIKPGVTAPGKTKGPQSAAIVKTTGNKTTVAAAKPAGAALAKTIAVQGTKTTVAKPTTSATANKNAVLTTTGKTVSQGSAKTLVVTPAKAVASTTAKAVTTSTTPAKDVASTIPAVKGASSSTATKIILSATSTTVAKPVTATAATPESKPTTKTATPAAKSATKTVASSGNVAAKITPVTKVMQMTSSSTATSKSASKSPVDKTTLTATVVLEKLGDEWVSSSQSYAKDNRESVAMETSNSRSPAESSSDEEGAEKSHDEDVNVSFQTSSDDEERKTRGKFNISRTKKQTRSVLQEPKSTSVENSQSVGKAKTTSTVSKKSACSTKEAKPAHSTKLQDGLQAKPKASSITKAPASSQEKMSAVNVLDMYQPVKRNVETPPDEPIDEVKGRARMIRPEKQIINRAKTVMLNPVRPADMADKALTKYFLESHCFSARFIGHNLHKGADKRGHLELRFFTEEEAQNSLTDLNGLKLDNGRRVNAKILYSQKGAWDGGLDDWQRSSAEEGIQESRCVFVNNIPGNSREEMIKLLFPDSKNIQLPRDEEGKTMGYALVECHSAEEAEEVVQASREFELRIGDSILSLNVIARKKRPKTDSEDQKTIDDAAKAPKRANDDTDGKIDEASAKKKGKFEVSDDKPSSKEIKYQGTDIKQLFHFWCNKNLCIPNYTYKSWGPTNRLMFRCEVRLSKFDYIGRGTCRTNKKDSQTKCAYDYVKFLIRQSLIESPAIIRCEETLVARGLVDVLNTSDDIQQEKPDGEEGTAVTADASITSEGSRPKAETDSRRDGLSWRERREQRRRSRSRSKERRHSREKSPRNRRDRSPKLTDPQKAQQSSQKKKDADIGNQRQKDIQALKAEITKQLAELQEGRVSDPDRLGELAQKLQSVQEEDEKRTQEQEDNPSGEEDSNQEDTTQEDTEKESGHGSQSGRNQQASSGGQSGDEGRQQQETNQGKRDRDSRRTPSPLQRENDAKKRRQDDLHRQQSSGEEDKSDDVVFLYKSTTNPPASSIQGGGLPPNSVPGVVGAPGYNQLMMNAPQQSQDRVTDGMMGTQRDDSAIPGTQPAPHVVNRQPMTISRRIPVSSASQGQQFNTSTGLLPGSGPSISSFQDPNSLKAGLIRQLKDLQEGRVSDNTQMLHELADSLLVVQRREEATGTHMGHTGLTTSALAGPNQGNNQTSQSAETPKPDHVAIRDNLLLRLQSLGVHSGTLNHLVKGLLTVQQQEKQHTTAPSNAPSNVKPKKAKKKTVAEKKRARQLQNQIHQKLVQQMSRQTLHENIRNQIQDEKTKIQEENKILLEQKRKTMSEQWNSQSTPASVSEPPHEFGSNTPRLSEISRQPSPSRIPPTPREVEQQRQQQEIEHSQGAPQVRFELNRPRGILKYKMGQQGDLRPDANRSSQYGWSPSSGEQTGFSHDSRYDPIPAGVRPITDMPTRGSADDHRIEWDEDGFRLPPTMSSSSNLERRSFPGDQARSGGARDRGAGGARGGAPGMDLYPPPLMAQTVKPTLKTQGASLPFNYEMAESDGRPTKNGGGYYRPYPSHNQPMGTFHDQPMGAFHDLPEGASHDQSMALSGLVDYPSSP